MAKQVQLRRGTTAQHATFTGALAEITVDTDKKVAVIHDGTTAGGFPLARADGVVATANALNTSNAYTGTSFNSITGLSSTTPAMNGTAAVGTATTAARADHVHPAQTTITGNAATATKLATARTINGVSFDGTANITVADSTKVAKVTSTDNAIVRFDGITGQVQNSSVYITDTGSLLVGTTTDNGVDKFQINGNISATTGKFDNYSVGFDAKFGKGDVYFKTDGITFGFSTEAYILSLTSHTDGYVYAGTHPNGKIFRSNNGTTWTEVLDSTETNIYSLTSHTDGYVYAGTYPNGKIFRSNNGTTWTEVLASTEAYILSLTSHTDGYVYAGTHPNGKIFRSNNGTTWTEVLDSTETNIHSLASHTDGYVYAGTHPNGKIFRSNNGTTWTEVLDSTETYILSLTSHTDGYVYAGTYPNGKIFRSNNGTTWTEVLASTEAYILSLTSHTDGYVYAGTHPNGKILKSFQAKLK